MEAKYKIGDKVWYATTRTVQKTMPCSECFGKKHLIVILGDDSQVPIPCVSCDFRDENSFGYDSYPHGYVHYYEFEAKAKEVVISKVEMDANHVEYRFDGGYCMDEDRAFDTEQEAIQKAAELAAKHNEEEQAKIYRKEKHNRTWAWNLHYHRDCIKRAERDLAYHTAKAYYAKTQVKEEKKVLA